MHLFFVVFFLTVLTAFCINNQNVTALRQQNKVCVPDLRPLLHEHLNFSIRGLCFDNLIYFKLLLFSSGFFLLSFMLLVYPNYLYATLGVPFKSGNQPVINNYQFLPLFYIILFGLFTENLESNLGWLMQV